MACKNSKNSELKTEKENKEVKFMKFSLIIRIFLFLISMIFLPLILILTVAILFGYIVMNDKNVINKITGWIITIGKSYNKEKDCDDCGDDDTND